VTACEEEWKKRRDTPVLRPVLSRIERVNPRHIATILCEEEAGMFNRSTLAHSFKILAIVVGAALALALQPAAAQDITRGTTTGQTTAKGYDHPNQFLHMQSTQIADNMEPVIPHPDQEKEARQQLAELEKKFGKKPNMLIFLMDDVGWMDPGFNGGGVAVGNPTPTMDRLAQEGLVLTSAYSTPSCTPTRASIHTGQNPLHHGLLFPPMYGQPGGLEGAVTIANILGQLGYVTQGVGKWHMGENDASQPQNVGYDDYYGFLSVSDMYTEWRDVYFNPEIALSPSRFAMLQQMPFNHNNVHCVKGQKQCQNTYELNLTTLKDLDQDWAAYSEKFIHKMATSQQPWFLYHATRGCHFDNYPNDNYAGRSPARTVFSDCMVEMDDVLARLVRALEDSGQLENTLIFLSSDNGPECEVPPHGRSPFRGCKGSSWEGGVRVPTFAYWKGRIKPRRSDGLFDLTDLFNTAASLAGAPGAEVAKYLPKVNDYIDGIDQLSFVVADNGESNRRSRIYTDLQYLSAIRIDEFKYHIVVELEQHLFRRGYTGGFSGSYATSLGGATMTNLYTNPQEDVSEGVRHIPVQSVLQDEMVRYQTVLRKYPPSSKMAIGLPQ
jgi:arylsulfatase